MNISVFIEPHERFEAIEAYRDRLTPEQIEEIEDAPEGALIQMIYSGNMSGGKIIVIEEG